MIRTLRYFGDPVLTGASAPVTTFDKSPGAAPSV
jgi:hypothetical protein